MHPHTTISPELREWILATTRAGHGVPEVLKLMKEHGYDPRQSRSIVAEVLKLPLAALLAGSAKGAQPGLRTKHPEAPEVHVDGHAIGVSLSVDAPALRILENVLGAQECDELIALARPRLQRALTVDSEGRQQVDRRRTSEGMFFTLNEVPLVGRIEQRLAALLGVPANHGEGLQILHYLPGQEYEPHFDWFDPEQPGYEAITAVGGQRIASVVMYLNTPARGGGTAFPEPGLTITARRGTAVYFAYEGGDRSSLHAGLPVLEGEKWIATKWLRERPYKKPAKA
ncbi:2-oxoglutarate-dependent dioxygenase [Rhodanobacter denitrificans]|uniref:2-oxoglutarate-dependent dioxygenase n=1 Tax=Rhodanobacter denitrificans TaxID=666685 RepID=A0A368KB92_9GAMM|nr:2OG-Fe(II) oxygenase [Rhodanobacter denitrificans]RCS29202.1 2-oxoglutarate-dependent dioxygenase [Rhodanobacter denitrificans]